MKNIVILFIILTFSTVCFGQSNDVVQLKNTYWKVISHQGNADTWTFVPVTEKPKFNANFEYLILKSNNKFQLHLSYNDCKKDVFGTYTVSKSKISFDYPPLTVEGKCDGFDYFRLENRSVVIKNNKLYLTKYSKWYDEKNIKNDTIIVEKEQLGRIERNEKNILLVNDANYIPMEDGNYKLNEEKNPVEKYIFTIKNGFLDGKIIRIAKDNKSEMILKQGRILSEKKWINGQIFLEKYHTEEVKKEADNYFITLKEVRNNYRSNDKDSTVTVFKNRKPVVKNFYQSHKLVSVKDFEKNTYQKFGYNNQLLEYEDSNKKIKYDRNGREKTKELFLNDGYELYDYDILKMKKTFAKDTITTILYDEKGKPIETKTEAKSNIPMYEIADPNKYALELSPEQFEYYKSILK